jgi:hypothetical protein
LKKYVLVLVLGLWAGLTLVSCGSSGKKNPPSGLPNRVLASQGVSSTSTFGGLVIINGYYDVIPRLAPIGAGTSPGLMAISPTRNIVAAFDSRSNSVYAVDTTKEADLGNGVPLSGPTTSMVIPTAAQIGYAAVPTASISGYSFVGGIQVMNLTGSVTTTIAVNNAQTVISNATGSQLVVFSPGSGSLSNSITVLSPGNAVPPVDTSCTTQPNAVCTVVGGFDQPVFGVISGSTAYILNCGPQCGGNQASVAVFDLGSLTITNTIPVDAATMAFLTGSTLYVAGTSPTNNACTGQTTAATTCGRLDVIDLGSMTVTNSIVITDGFHDRMDMALNNQLFVGSYGCTEIGDVNNPSGEVRGCLSIFNVNNGSVVVPPDNGDVGGLQSFTSRYVEYVAEGGNLRVYDTTKDILLINDFVPLGTINIVGYIGDVKAIDFF